MSRRDDKPTLTGRQVWIAIPGLLDKMADILKDEKEDAPSVVTDDEPSR